jgi:hypothetical protein
MTTETRRITVGGIAVDVVRKDIRNLHLGVYPPHGRVRLAAPLVVSDEAVRLAVIDKLGWIKRQRTKFAEQPRQSRREMVNAKVTTSWADGIDCECMSRMAPAGSSCAASRPLISSFGGEAVRRSAKPSCSVGTGSN